MSMRVLAEQDAPSSDDGRVRRKAVLVGVDRYWNDSWTPLEFAERDCQNLRDALLNQAEYGFDRDDVLVYTGGGNDPRRHAIRSNLLYDGLFQSPSEADLDLFLFYFAGHGQEVDGVSYLVPADGVRSHVPETCVRLDQLLGRIARVPARQRLIVFDACHSSGIRGGAGSEVVAGGMPESFVEAARQEDNVVVLSSCDVKELSHESEQFRAGVYTHFWCDALNGRVLPREGRLSVFAVHDYAEDQTKMWADSRGWRQNPQILARGPSVFLLPVADSSNLRIPTFLENRVARTERLTWIVRERSRQLTRLPIAECTVRIKAMLSSFGSIDEDFIAWVDDEADVTEEAGYGRLLKNEREAMVELFKAGGRFQILLTWSVAEMLGWSRSARENIIRRMTTLREFCESVVESRNESRMQIIHVPIRDRNLLFLGTEYLFEGRKLSTGAGFEATRVIRDREAVAQEIDMFDRLFNHSLERARRSFSIQAADNLNERLIEAIIRQLDTDVLKIQESL